MTHAQLPHPLDVTRLLWTSGQPPISNSATRSSQGWLVPVQVGTHNPQVMSHMNTSSQSFQPPSWPYDMGQARQTFPSSSGKPPRMKTQRGNTRFNWMADTHKRELRIPPHPQGPPGSVWVIDEASHWQSACTSCVADRTACIFTAPDKQFCTACHDRPSHCEIEPKSGLQMGGVGLGAAPYGS
jgi:hypothetical protein